jgi:hypothetical protein
MGKIYCTHVGDDKFLQYLGGISVWKIPFASPRRGQVGIILINFNKKLGVFINLMAKSSDDLLRTWH